MKQNKLRLELLIFVFSVGYKNFVHGRKLKEDDNKVPNIRANRFPSVEERVKLYMSNWYHPSCESYEDGFVLFSYSNQKEWPTVRIQQLRQHPLVEDASRIMEIESVVSPDMLMFMDEETIRNCAIPDFDDENSRITKDARTLEVAERVEFRKNMRMYCHDVQDSVFAAWNHVQWEKSNQGNSSSIPLLMQFGDNKDSHKFGSVTVPYLKKFRSAARSPKALEQTTRDGKTCYATPREALATAADKLRLEPIVWKFATHRHFERLYQVSQMDTAWSHKKDMAIFRGQLTGSRFGYEKDSAHVDNCNRLARCRLVYQNANSKLIDAKLTSTRSRMPDEINNVTIKGPKIGLDEQMQYKGIIMLEGNDVASGLKWALLSKSVVLMPIPKHSSWAMEELLKPWVHFIPLDDDLSDVEERMQWIVDNDSEAQRISERATLWMEDLVFHPDAAEDDRLIQEEMIRRYQAHFRPM